MPASTYKNFRDPFGLAWRMISDGRSIGRQAIARELLGKGLSPFDWLLQPLDRRIATDVTGEVAPMIFVVGPPRSGTTLVAQVLTDFLDVSYFSNLNSMFPRSPLVAQRLFQRLLRGPNREYRSLYGVTSGMHGANDAFHVWNRFLGADRYRAASGLTAAEQERLRDFFRRWSAIAGKPLLNKNNRNLACADMLADALPSARFVCVVRDPLHVVQSLVNARKWVQGDAKIGWGLFAENARDDSEEAIVEAVCNQVEQNLRCVAAVRAHIPEERWLEVPYESFCDDPRAVVRDVRQRAPGVELRPGRELDALRSFRVSDQLTLAASSQDRIRDRLSGLICDRATVVQSSPRRDREQVAT